MFQSPAEVWLVFSAASLDNRGYSDWHAGCCSSVTLTGELIPQYLNSKQSLGSDCQPSVSLRLLKLNSKKTKLFLLWKVPDLLFDVSSFSEVSSPCVILDSTLSSSPSKIKFISKSAFFYPLLFSNQPSISNIATKIIHAFISFLLDGILFAFPSRPLDELQHVLTAAHLAPTLTPYLYFWNLFRA